MKPTTKNLHTLPSYDVLVKILAEDKIVHLFKNGLFGLSYLMQVMMGVDKETIIDDLYKIREKRSEIK